MTWRPQPLPPVPAATAAAVWAAFPEGNLYVDPRTAFGPLYDDQLFADLYAEHGRPIDVAPWRLALVMVMRSSEGLTDRQAADAVRRCMDWKDALSLELTDRGLDLTLLHDFRQRMLAPGAAQRLLDTFDRLQSPRLDQSPGHPTDGFHPRPSGCPYASPFRMRAGSHAPSPQPAR